MALRITKQGKNPLMAGVCKHCGCECTCMLMETNFKRDDDDEVVRIIECPTCKLELEMTEKAEDK